MTNDSLIEKLCELSEALKAIYKDYPAEHYIPVQISKILYLSERLLRVNYILLDDLYKSKHDSEKISFYFGMRACYVLLDLNTLILVMQNTATEIKAGHYFYYNLKRLDSVFRDLESILDGVIDSVYAPDANKKGNDL